MALLRKLFYRKPPDGLLEISERVYVFDCCFTNDSWNTKNFKSYIADIVSQLREQFPDASLLVFNFREVEAETVMSKIMSEYDMTIMDYPTHYEQCPILSMELIHHFLRSTESWLALGPHNVLLMHCERGAWPVLAFMLAALLIYRKQYTGEQRTLDMVYKQAPRELLPLSSPLNPMPSQLRYLQYISRRNVASQWPPLDRALTLDCIIIRLIPDCNGEGGFRPIFRIYGQDPLGDDDRAPKVLLSTPRKSKAIRLYKQEESELVKIDINCNIQGDVVLECSSLRNDMECEDVMFRVMFNTAFIRSNILMLNRDEIDTLWHTKDHFPKDFRAEILFSDMDAAASKVATKWPCFEEKEGLPVEAFAKVQEFFSQVDWLDSRADAALNVLQKISASRISHENLDFATADADSSSPLHRSSPKKLKEENKYDFEQNIKNHDSEELSKMSKSSGLGGKKAGLDKLQAPNQYQLGVIGVKQPDTSLSLDMSMLPTSASPRVLQDWPSTPPGGTEDVQVASLTPVLPDLTCSVKPTTASIVPPQGNSLTSAASAPVQLPRQPHLAESEAKLPSEQSDAGIRNAYQSSASNSPSKPLASPPLLLPHQTTDLDNSSTPGSFRSPPSPLPPIASAQVVSRFMDRPSPSPPSVDQLAKFSVKEDSSERAGGWPAPSSLSPSSTSLKAEHCSGRAAPPPLSPPQTSPALLRLESKFGAPPPPPPPPVPPHFTPALTRPLPTISSQLPKPSMIENTALRAEVHTPAPPIACDASSQISVDGSSKTKPSSPPPSPAEPSRGFGGEVGRPPPPPTVPSKDYSGKAGPPPAPPPPLQLGLSSSTPAPPPPPPPAVQHVDSSSQHSSSVPCAPPPPNGFNKGAPKTGTAPAPAPPLNSPLLAKGRSLSRSLGPKNPQTKKLKPLHWLKLTRAVQGSLWAETQKSGEASIAPEIDMSELENLFSASVPSSDRGAAKSTRGVAGPKSDKVQLIDHRRAYNCEIMLSKVKVPLQELMGSVLSLEESALDVDQVENLVKFCPTKEEMELLKGYKGEVDKLGKCEQFFLELMRVPRVETKLRVFSFKMQFNTQVSDLRKSLNIVNSVADQIRSSMKLKRIMQTILSLGNALNQGTARGSAVGFRLDSLLKLTETRARNNKMTLMHYLCKVISEKLPELLDFPGDLTSLEPASKIQIKYLAEEMQAINKGLEKIVQELSMAENDGPVSEEFRKNLKEFLSFAEAEVRSLALLYSGVGRHIDALIVYFGEDPARCPFEQVVSTLLNFTRTFSRAHEDNCKQLELEKKKAEKDLQNQKLAGQTKSDKLISSPSKSGTIQ